MSGQQGYSDQSTSVLTTLSLIQFSWIDVKTLENAPQKHKFSSKYRKCSRDEKDNENLIIDKRQTD